VRRVIVDFSRGRGISGFFQREGEFVDFFRCGPTTIFQGDAPVMNFYFNNKKQKYEKKSIVIYQMSKSRCQTCRAPA